MIDIEGLGDGICIFFFTGTHSWTNPNDFCEIWVLLFLVPKNETYQKDEMMKIFNQILIEVFRAFLIHHIFI